VKGLLAVSRAIDRLNEGIGRVTAWAIVAAVLVSAINAIIRKVFEMSSNAWLELQWYLFGAVFMLCAAWTLRANEHIRIDIVSSRLSYRTRNIVEMIGHLFFLLPFVVVMIYLSTPFFLRSAQSGEVSTNRSQELIQLRSVISASWCDSLPLGESGCLLRITTCAKHSNSSIAPSSSMRVQS